MEFELPPGLVGKEELIATLQTLKDKLNANIDPEPEEIETLKQIKAQLERDAETEPDE